jgi:hypothetical protein
MTLRPKKAARIPHFSPTDIRLGNRELTAVETITAVINRTAGHTQALTCTILMVAKRSGAKISPPRTSLRTPPRSSKG